MKNGKSVTRLPENGGDGGIRTLDLTDANRTISQLSYAPMFTCKTLEKPTLFDKWM